MTTNFHSKSTAFVNWKRYSKDGITDLNETSPNDNFIIKGDNQKVLNSLLSEYQSKIKLIWIDKPTLAERMALLKGYEKSWRFEKRRFCVCNIEECYPPIKLIKYLNEK